MAFPAAYAITANSLTAETFRLAPSSLIAGTGVVGSGDLVVAANGIPNMSVTVAAGQVWIPGTLASTAGFGFNLGAQTAYGLPSTLNEQGCYFAWNNASVTLAISAADPTNPRYDLICASIQDAAYAGSLNAPVLQVITGTPAPSPLAPAVPASTVILAYVYVAAAATSITSGNITDIRPFILPAAQAATVSETNASRTVKAGYSLKGSRTGITYVTGGFTVNYAAAFPASTDAVLVTVEATSTSGYQMTVLHASGFAFKAFTGGVEVANGTSLVIDWLAVGH